MNSGDSSYIVSLCPPSVPATPNVLDTRHWSAIWPQSHKTKLWCAVMPLRGTDSRVCVTSDSYRALCWPWCRCGQASLVWSWHPLVSASKQSGWAGSQETWAPPARVPLILCLEQSGTWFLSGLLNWIPLTKKVPGTLDHYIKVEGIVRKNLCVWRGSLLNIPVKLWNYHPIYYILCVHACAHTYAYMHIQYLSFYIL